MSKQRVYRIIPIFINGLKISEVIIDPHYEKKHGASINDELILNLVRQLNCCDELALKSTERYSYFTNLIKLNDKQYRLVWLLENNETYIGIVNVYRDKRRI